MSFVLLAGLGPMGIRDPLIDTIASEACYRGFHGLANSSPHNKARELFTLLTHLRKISEEGDVERSVEAAVVAKFERAIREGKPIQMYIPCFPAKSPNHVGKTLGPNPDLAEQIAINRLRAVVDAMNQIHPSKLIIASDGRIFADTWWSTDKEVDSYRDELRAMLHTPNITLMDLNDYFPGFTAQQARDHILTKYGPTVEEIRQSMESDPKRLALYLAFSKFIEGDTPPNDPALVGLSSNAKKRLYKERALEDIRRSDALNNFLVEHFVDQQGFIRLSIRDSVDTPDKIGINLLDSSRQEFSASPWHSVITIFPDGSYKPMKRSEAEQAGYRLVHVNGRPSHFEAQDMPAPLTPSAARPAN